MTIVAIHDKHDHKRTNNNRSHNGNANIDINDINGHQRAADQQGAMKYERFTSKK